MNYIIIYKIIYNMIIVIALIFISFLFIIRVMKKTLSHIVSFDVIKKTLSFYSNIKLRDFQVIKKRYFLINEIINEIAVLESRLGYYIFVVVKISTFIYN